MYEIFEMLCKDRDITPYKVCKETGISTSTISSWKAGRYTPKQEKLQKIAECLGVSLEYLMTGKEPEEKSQYYINDDAREYAQFLFENPEYKVLFDATRKVKKEDIAFVKEMIDRTSKNDE